MIRPGTWPPVGRLKGTAARLVVVTMMTAGAAAPATAQDHSLFYRFDANEDGVIAFPEFKEAHGYRFAAADIDGNGDVTAGEWLAARPGGRMRADRADVLFERLDADASGTLTASEFDNAADWWFEQLDLDANGVLSLDELGPQWRPGAAGATEAVPGR